MVKLRRFLKDFLMNKIIALTMISTLSLKAADVTVHLPQEEKEDGPYKPHLRIDLDLIDMPKEDEIETIPLKLPTFN